jgi:eukaryotic-like serine/threonine-protein kinase
MRKERCDSRLDQEIRCLVEGYEGMRAREARMPWPHKKRLRESGGRIVPFYEAWGKTDKAAEWRARLGLADLPANVFSP